MAQVMCVCRVPAMGESLSSDNVNRFHLFNYIRKWRGFGYYLFICFSNYEIIYVCIVYIQ